MAFIGWVLFFIGIAICLIYGIQLVILAFQESVLWGLAYLFVPFANLVFVFKYWEDTKAPFLKCLIAVPFFAVAVILIPSESMATDSSEGYITSSDTNCKLHNAEPQPNETATWSGGCKDGYADGHGVLNWYESGKLTQTTTGNFVKGNSHGHTVTEDFIENYHYEGNIRNGLKSGFSRYTIAPSNVEEINSLKSEGTGKYEGKNYIVEGIYEDDWLVKECKKSEC